MGTSARIALYSLLCSAAAVFSAETPCSGCHTYVNNDLSRFQCFGFFGLDVPAIVDRWKSSLDLLQGCKGIDGEPGPEGEPGEPGPTGDSGTQGITGPPGVTGDVGAVGSPGDIGFPGVPGVIGKDGLQGPKGQRGDPAEGPRSCRDLRDLGMTLTGWYYIYPDGSPMRVMCDMETDGGGWIVFQRRSDGSVDFNRNWDSYKKGFGNQWSEFWLGNDNIHLLTSTGNFQLRVDLADFDNNRTYATYSNFKLGGESEKYPLYLRNYIGGTAGDSLSSHNNRKFSTIDNDNDSSKRANCAEIYSAPWWHTACFDSSLNGEYLRGEHNEKGGIAWSSFKKIEYSLKFSEMKFRQDE